MNGGQLASRAVRLIAVVTLVASGTYVLVYLYRWEWNRALISGIFFLGAEIALATSLLLAKLQALQAAPDVQAAPDRHAVPAAPAVPPAAGDDPEPFAWLRPVTEGFGMFVPLLLGAGAILSAVAFVVERIARLSVPRAARSPAHWEDVLALPAGGFTGRAAPALPAGDGSATGVTVTGAPWISGQHRSAHRVLAVTVVLLAAGAVLLLALATQTRPDPRLEGTTTLVVELSQPNAPPEPDAALALWSSCRLLLPTASYTAVLEGPERLRVTVDTVLGRFAQRKLVGCLEDATIDHVHGHVVVFETHPAAGQGGPAESATCVHLMYQSGPEVRT